MSWARVACATALLLAACGPSRSGAAIADAERLSHEVKTASIQTFAAFEVARGDAFLRHARRAAGHSQHDFAVKLARTAADSYFQARAVAREHQKLKHFRPYRLDWDSPVVP